MSGEDQKSLRRSSRLKTVQMPKTDHQSTALESEVVKAGRKRPRKLNPEDSREKPSRSSKRKKTDKKLVINIGCNEIVGEDGAEIVGDKGVSKREVQSSEIHEIDEFADVPELNPPREWMELLKVGPSSSAASSSNKDEVMADEDGSSEDEWHEVEAPEIQANKIAVEFHIEKKKSNAEKQMEKLVRQEIEREIRQYQEDCRQMHFLAYLCHLRYQMLCVKEFCDKYKDKLNELINFDLVNIPNPSVEDQLKDFRGRFTESNQLCAEKSRNSLFERLHSALKNSIFETDKDLALVFIVLFLSFGFKCRLCIGFTPGPNLEADKTKKSDARDPKSTKENDVVKSTYWAEYFDESKKSWFPIHPSMCSAKDIEKVTAFTYVLGIDNDMTVFDLSGWYFRNYLHSSFRKNRLSDTWIRGFLRRPVFCSNKTEVAREDKRLRDYLLSKPMPVVVSEFKNHPLYVLEKDLLKFEALYPKDTLPLGQIRSHKIYPRSSVFILQGELNWIREARSVKEGEEPYKVVKARPKLSVPVEERVPLFLNVYGYWQTEPYVPPEVVDGTIPRNEYGNVYMYKPEMVPLGCTHLRIRGVLLMAKTLGLQAVPAVVGWEFSGGRNHPILDGCVVLKRDAEVLRNACLEWQENHAQKRVKAVEDRAFQLWRRFIKGKLLLERIKRRFNIQ